MSETNCATICASSKVTDCLNATDPATLTASPQRVFKSRCYFCSSTNGYADHCPTAASTAVRTLKIAQTADLKPPTTAPTRPSRTSSICSPPRDRATSLLESSCGCADHLPTAASTAVRTLKIAQTADLKPSTTAPTRPSRTSSICSSPRDGATLLLESSCLTSLRLGQRFLGSNHIRQPQRACRTMCG